MFHIWQVFLLRFSRITLTPGVKMHLQYTHLNWISLSTKCLYTLLYTSVVIFLFHIDGAAERGAQTESCSYTLSLLPFTDRSNVLALKRCVTVASATKTMCYCKCLHSPVLSQTPQELWRCSRADTLTCAGEAQVSSTIEPIRLCAFSLSLSLTCRSTTGWHSLGDDLPVSILKLGFPKQQ